MRMAASFAGLLLSFAIAGAQAPGPGAKPTAAPPPGATQPAAETLEFAIMRNGEQIGTHKIELRRTGKNTSVNVAINIEVKILFVTAYRFQHLATERWVNGRLFALNCETDDN